MVTERRSLAPFFLLALLLALAVVSFTIAKVFLNYLLLALFLGYISHPIYQWIRKKVRVAGLAAFTTVVLIIGTIIVPLVYLTINLVGELSRVLRNLDVGTFRAEFDSLARRLFDFFGQTYESDGAAGAGLLEIIIPRINEFISGFATGILGTFASAMVGLFVFVYILYYTYIDGGRMVETIRDILPLQESHKDQLLREVGQVVKAVFFGTILTSALQAVIAGAGYALFGVTNVVFWSVITFILALLPVIGPPLIWFPWGMILLLQGETFRGVGLLLYGAVMVSTLDNFIRPKIIGEQAHVHPAIILIGVLGGVVVFGFAGFILGPLILAMFATVVNMYRKEFAATKDQRLPLEAE